MDCLSVEKCGKEGEDYKWSSWGGRAERQMGKMREEMQVGVELGRDHKAKGCKHFVDDKEPVKGSE